MCSSRLLGAIPQAWDIPADRAATDDNDGIGRVPGDISTVDAVDPGVVGGYPCGQEGTSEGGKKENLGTEDHFCSSSPAT